MPINPSSGPASAEYGPRAALLCSLATLLAWLFTQYLTPLRVASYWLEDLRIAYFSAPTEQHPDIVVLTITEDTLAELPFRSPINRAYLADKLDILARNGASIVGLEILIDQATTEADDRRLISALKAFPGSAVVVVGDRQTNLTERQLAAQHRLLDGIPVGLGVLPKTDGVARFTFPGRASDGKFVPSFANVMAMELGASPLTESRRIAFRPPPGGQQSPFRMFPLHFLDQLPGIWFADKIVLIGADLPHQDRHRTPFSIRADKTTDVPGVVVHAHMLAQIVDNRQFPVAGAATDVSAIAAMAVLGFLLPLLGLNIVVKVAYGVLIVVGYWAIGITSYANAQILIPLLSPTLGFLIGISFATGFGRHHEREAKRFLRRAFGHYVSPSVIDNLVANPENLNLGGEKRTMSFVFSDIAAFTTISETLSPQELVSLLQDYFDGMAEIAMKFEGTIERFLGDSVLVFFGAPLYQADHAERAVHCALEWDDYCQEFRRKQLQHKLDFGETRIGVHTGSAVVGNVGSRDRFEYTAHGDTVNAAARLETANKHFGTRVCISRAAADLCKGVKLRPIGNLIFKGKEEALNVLSSFGELPEDAWQQYLDAYESMRREEPESLELFAALAARYPGDGLTAFHLDRLRRGQRGTTIRMEQK